MKYIIDAANNLTNKYTTRDPFELAKCLGIQVVFFPFKKIRGLIIELGNKKVIGLNSELNEHIQRAVLAHELGHHEVSPVGVGYFFLEEQTHYSLNKQEYQANYFAAILLLSDTPPEYGENIEQYAARVQVPIELAKIKLIT